VAIAIIYFLPEIYSTLKTILLSTPEDKLSSDVIINHILVEEKSQQSQLTFQTTFITHLGKGKGKAHVIATTCRNGTRDMLTSAKLSVGYLVVEITRELNKELSLYYLLYIYMAPGPCYNNIYPALKSMPLPHVLLLIHMCFP